MTEELNQVALKPVDLDGLPSFPTETETAESGDFVPVQKPRVDEHPILGLIVALSELLGAFVD